MQVLWLHVSLHHAPLALWFIMVIHDLFKSWPLEIELLPKGFCLA